MIARQHSKAVHLFLALPAASFAGAALITLFMGGAELFEPPFQLLSLAQLILVPVAALVPTLYVLPIAVLVGVPAYFMLRRSDQLRLSFSLGLGMLPGLLLGLVAYLDFHTVAFLLVFPVLGALSSAVAYIVLARMATRSAQAATVVIPGT